MRFPWRVRQAVRRESGTPLLARSLPAEGDWRTQARAERRRQGAWRFWFGWGGVGRREVAAALDYGRFTPRARWWLGRFVVVRVPSGVAWAAAWLASRLPAGLPGVGALPRTPWVGACCLAPLPLILGVEAALTAPVLAHELAHALWFVLPRERRRAFPIVLARQETVDPDLAAWLDRALAGYRDRRSPRECHVRLLEYYDWGRRPLPPELVPFYAEWIDLAPSAAAPDRAGVPARRRFR